MDVALVFEIGSRTAREQNHLVCMHLQIVQNWDKNTIFLLYCVTMTYFKLKHIYTINYRATVIFDELAHSAVNNFVTEIVW